MRRSTIFTQELDNRRERIFEDLIEVPARPRPSYFKLVSDPDKIDHLLAHASIAHLWLDRTPPAERRVDVWVG